MDIGHPRFQGDVMLRKVEALPEGELVPAERDAQGRLILAQGEATGHHHAVVEKTATLLVDPISGDRYLVAPDGAVLAHEEHAEHVLEPGIYRVGNQGIPTQREYSPEEIRNVAD